MSIYFEQHILPDNEKKKAEYAAKGYKFHRMERQNTYVDYDYSNPIPKDFEVWRQELYPGAVLCTRERNYYDDSDFYAVVWDAERQTLDTCEYATTRFGGGGYAKIDATDDVKDAAARVIADWLFTSLKQVAVSEALQPTKGKRVVVARGRKYPVGTLGSVKWHGLGKAIAGIRHKRCLVATDDLGDIWIDAANLNVVDPESHTPSDDDLRAAAEHRAARVRENDYGWHLPFAAGSGLVVM